MKYEFKSLKQVLDLFEENSLLGATEISNLLGISTVVVHKYIKELVKQKKLKKIGKPPRTKYQSVINQEKNKVEEKPNVNACFLEKSNYIPDFKEEEILKNTFYKFTADGNILTGFSGISEWCKFRNLNLEEKIKNYISINKHIESLKNECGLLDAGKSFGKHFEEVFLDNTFYADQYKWMEFGRGKLAEMTFYGKQSQNTKLIGECIDEIILKLKCMILKGGYDSIGITPWSIERKNQLLGLLETRLKSLGLPFINIIKYYPNDIPIPQKSLKTREQRIKNARNTIYVDDENISKYNKTFLIDDFVGSGSTLNETASKLKTEGIEYVTGFAFVGNLNLEYEVINEV